MHSRPITGSTSRRIQQERTQRAQDWRDLDRSEDEGMSEAPLSRFPKSVITLEERPRARNGALDDASATGRRVKVHKRSGIFQVTIAGKFYGDYLNEKYAMAAADTACDQSDD